MLKKTLLLLSALTLFTMAGCGADQEEANQNGSSNNDAPAEDKDKKENAEEKETDNKSDVYFKNNEVKTNDLKIKITETKVIPAGEKGNEYGDKPVFAIWYDTTNLTDKDIDPTTAWIAIFEAVQDNDPNAVNKLDISSLPDDRFRDSQTETIKKDGTVANAVAYTLDDVETPVTLIASQGILGDKIGEQTFEIK